MNDSGRKWTLLMVVLAGASLVSAMGNSIMTVVLPVVKVEFATSSAAVGATATAQLVAVAVLTPLYGRFAEIYRFRTVFLGAGILFVIGSIAAGSAPGIGVLIASRALQGAGGAGLITLGAVAVPRVVDPSHRGWAFGVIASGTGLGQASGPAVGGLIAELAGWRAMFGVTAALAGLVLIGALRALPRDRNPPHGRLRDVDLLGAAALGACIAFALLALLGFLEPNRSAPTTWAFTVAAAVFAVGLGLRVRACAHPFVPARLLTNARFLATCAVGFLSLYAFLATETLIPLLAAETDGLGSGQIGLILLPGTVTIVLVSTPVGRMTDRFGPRAVGLLGLTTLGGATLGLSVAAGGPAWTIAAGMLGIGVGFAVSTVPVLAAAAFVLPPVHHGTGLGLYQSVYALGGAVGAVLSPALLTLRRGASGQWNPFVVNAYSDALLIVGAPVLFAVLLTLALPCRADWRRAAMRKPVAIDCKRTPTAQP